MALVLFAFLLNAAVTSVLPVALLRGVPRMASVYGPDGPARRILACLYGTIAAASVTGLALLALGRVREAALLGAVLFSMQIAYKVATAFAVGVTNPVVRANLAICLLLAAALVQAAAILGA